MEEGKGRGLSFAEKQLLCHGWERGKGLGRAGKGISEAIKVKVKADKAGVGHKEGDQFTFHWWDHVFNKASSSLQVEADQGGVQLKKNPGAAAEGVGAACNKKPLKASSSKEKLYGRFVKSATLLSGHEQPEPKSSPSEDGGGGGSLGDEDDRRLDLSSTADLSDADLVSACGGRTAHKGARYGLTMSAKLARLEQQEAEFMAKYGKRDRRPPPPGGEEPALESADGEEEAVGGSSRKTVGGRRSRKALEEVAGGSEAHVTSKKKKKKRRKSVDEETLVSAEGGDSCVETLKKRKKKKAEAEPSGEERTAAPDDPQPERKTKKKKSSRRGSEEGQEGSAQSELLQDGVPNVKRKKSKRKTTSSALM